MTDGNDFFDEFDFFDDGSDFERYGKERDRQLAEFKKMLLRGEGDCDFDEAKWTTLADDAFDDDDYYLVSEILHRGLINYPDSVWLNERRLKLLDNTLSPKDARMAFQIAEAEGNQSLYLNIKNAYYQWADMPPSKRTPLKGYKMIRDILLSEDKIQDFELVEGIAIIADMGALKNLKREMEAWENATNHIEMLWYQFTMFAIEYGQSSLAVTIIRKLNETFPYNRLYWMLKARILSNEAFAKGAKNQKEAQAKVNEIINIIDTALAIDPDDINAQLVKNHISDIKDSLVDELIEKYKAIHPEKFQDEVPDGIDINRKSSDPLDLDQMIALLESNNPICHKLVDEWVNYQIKKHKKFLDMPRWPQNDNPEEPNLCQMAEALMLLNRHDLALRLARTATEIARKPVAALLPLQTLVHFINGHYIEASESFLQIKDDNANESMRPDLTKLVLAIIMRSHMNDTKNANELFMVWNVENAKFALSRPDTMVEYLKENSPVLLHYLLNNLIDNVE